MRVATDYIYRVKMSDRENSGDFNRYDIKMKVGGAMLNSKELN